MIISAKTRRNVTRTKPKTRDGAIFRAFILALDDLYPLVGKESEAALRRKAWLAVRKRVRGVKQSAVTRALARVQNQIAVYEAGEISRRKRRKTPA